MSLRNHVITEEIPDLLNRSENIGYREVADGEPNAYSISISEEGKISIEDWSRK